jgi:cobyrinic acid a,c-diamide synthase
VKGVMIAGTASGVGKTTITCGLIGVLRTLGLVVAPFKVGPDYIDPSYHARVAGRPCHTLDSWMVSHGALRQIFARATRAADIAVVEGVMGLFDGRSGGGEAGSTAEVAKLLGLPVVLVVDAAKTARSAAAQVLGFQRFDPALRVAGVILNNLASPHHAALCTEPITAATGLPVLGALQRTDALRVPERYLGLVPTVEGRVAEQFFADAIERVVAQVDLPQLLRIADEVHQPEIHDEDSPWPAVALPERLTIAVARDEAFSFMYPENLDLLTSWGAAVAPFSPLYDRALPAGTAGVYLGGGFPELYAEALAGNLPMLAALRAAAALNLPIYAECGGLMYLSEQLTDGTGRSHAMAGIAPLRSSMAQRRLTLGYRVATAQTDGPHLTRGQAVRGHEFHWSTLEQSPAPKDSAYEVDGGRHEGYARGNVWASYVHLHFATDTRIAPRFIAQCEAAASGS